MWPFFLLLPLRKCQPTLKVEEVKIPSGECFSPAYIRFHRRCFGWKAKTSLLFSPGCIGVSEDQEPSVGVFSNHTGPVHGLQVHDGRLYTCSGDNTARAYSLMVRSSGSKMSSHFCPSVSLLTSVSLPWEEANVLKLKPLSIVSVCFKI